MKVTTIFCDICKAENASTCYFYVDRKMDLAGSMEDVEELIDLCSAHQWAAYKLAEQLLSFDERSVILRALRDKVSRLDRVEIERAISVVQCSATHSLGTRCMKHAGHDGPHQDGKEVWTHA